MSVKRTQRSTRTKTKRRVGPPTRDKHRLYELSVQSPDVNAAFIDWVFKRRKGRPAALLKEDFCGTAILAAEWVKKREENRAIGVDLHKPTLQWAMKHNIRPLGATAKRVKLVRADVRDVLQPKVDVVAALNFSYFIFKTPAELRGYFRAARRSLKREGMLVLDMFGGWEAQMDLKDKTRYGGFTYVWEQEGVNPVTNEGRFHIHFNFHGGNGGIRRAFTYDWRLWTVPEVREALLDVGFKNVNVYTERIDPETDDGNGLFKRVSRFENCPGWLIFVVAD